MLSDKLFSFSFSFSVFCYFPHCPSSSGFLKHYILSVLSCWIKLLPYLCVLEIASTAKFALEVYICKFHNQSIFQLALAEKFSSFPVDYQEALGVAICVRDLKPQTAFGLCVIIAVFISPPPFLIYTHKEQNKQKQCSYHCLHFHRDYSNFWLPILRNLHIYLLTVAKVATCPTRNELKRDLIAGFDPPVYYHNFKPI